MTKHSTNMQLYSIDFDNVIKSQYITASTNYEYALNNLVPLIDRLDIQRNIQDSKFYVRLEKDIIKGCIMPPLTLAFIDNTSKTVKIDNADQIAKYIKDNIKEGFILDGIQRLNTLQRAYKKYPNELNLNRAIFLNIVICSSMDNLLYRMITLNNGQKPMSARHQIEILTANLFEFENSETPIISEKNMKKERKKVSFNRADFIKGYLAFLANSTNIENQKIIADKLDALIADKILDSNLTEDDLEFTNVIDLINKLTKNKENLRWFKNSNNLIGFCVGIKKNFHSILKISTEDFKDSIIKFEQAFESFDVSKIKVGKIRRTYSSHFIQNYETLKDLSALELVDILSQVD